MMEESSTSILTFNANPRADTQLSSKRRDALGRLGRIKGNDASFSALTEFVRNGNAPRLPTRKNLFAHERHDFKAALRQRIMQTREIGHTAHEPFVDISTVTSKNFEKHVRIGRFAAFDECRNEKQPCCRGNGECDRTGELATAASDLSLCLLHLTQNDLTALEQHAARLGQRHAVPMTREQSALQNVFQAPDLPADGRL